LPLFFSPPTPVSFFFSNMDVLLKGIESVLPFTIYCLFDVFSFMPIPPYFLRLPVCLFSLGERESEIFWGSPSTITLTLIPSSASHLRLRASSPPSFEIMFQTESLFPPPPFLLTPSPDLLARKTPVFFWVAPLFPLPPSPSAPYSHYICTPGLPPFFIVLLALEFDPPYCFPRPFPSFLITVLPPALSSMCTSLYFPRTASAPNSLTRFPFQTQVFPSPL